MKNITIVAAAIAGLFAAQPVLAQDTCEHPLPRLLAGIEIGNARHVPGRHIDVQRLQGETLASVVRNYNDIEPKSHDVYDDGYIMSAGPRTFLYFALNGCVLLGQEVDPNVLAGLLTPNAAP